METHGQNTNFYCRNRKQNIDEALAPNDIENIVITGIDANGKEYDFVFPTLVTGGWFGEDPEIMSIKIVVGVSITPGFPFMFILVLANQLATLTSHIMWKNK